MARQSQNPNKDGKDAMKQSTMKRIPHNKILSVTIKRMLDDSPDTSWLGEYSNSPSSDFSIDRAHSEDCASISDSNKTAIEKLERVIQHINRERMDAGNDPDNTEWESLDESIDCLIALQEELEECDCGEHGDMGRNEYRYFNPSFNYVDKAGNPTDGLTPEDVRKYTRQDYERMESLNRGSWCFIGIRADAEIGIPQGKAYLTQKLTSGGVGGYESDMSKTDFDSAEEEQLSELRSVLEGFGFSKRAIATAFKSIEHKDE